MRRLKTRKQRPPGREAPSQNGKGLRTAATALHRSKFRGDATSSAFPAPAKHPFVESPEIKRVSPKSGLEVSPSKPMFGDVAQAASELDLSCFSTADRSNHCDLPHRLDDHVGKPP